MNDNSFKNSSFELVNRIKKLTEENTKDEMSFITKTKKIIKEKRNDSYIYYKYNKNYISIYRKNNRNWFLRLNFCRISYYNIISCKLKPNQLKMILKDYTKIKECKDGISEIYFADSSKISFNALILKSYDYIVS